jgi:hypothetical protein
VAWQVVVQGLQALKADESASLSCLCSRYAAAFVRPYVGQNVSSLPINRGTHMCIEVQQHHDSTQYYDLTLDLLTLRAHGLERCRRIPSVEGAVAVLLLARSDRK